MGDYLSTERARQLLGDQVRALYTVHGRYQEGALREDVGRAEGVVNAYLSARYTVPVTGAGRDADFLEEVTAALLHEIAWRRSAKQAPDHVQKAAERAERRLKDVSRGVILLGGSETPSEQQDRAGTIIVDGPDPSFDRDNVRGW